MRGTKVLLASAAMLVLGLALLGLAGCKDSHEGHTETSATYACAMHPEMMASWAAKCPTCQMDMTQIDKAMPKDMYACKACGMTATFETKCPKCGMVMTKPTQ